MNRLLGSLPTLVILLLLATLGLGVSRYQGLQSEIDNLRRELKLSQQRISVLQTLPTPALAVKGTEAENRPAKTTHISESARLQASVDWKVTRRLEEAAKFTTLSPEESDNLREQLLNAGGGVNIDEVEPIFSRVLGPERTSALYRARAAAQAHADEQRLEVESIQLARALSLSDEKQAAFKTHLKAINEDLAQMQRLFIDKQEEVTSLHMEGEPARDKLRSGFRELEALSKVLESTRQERIREALRPMLNDNQYQQLVKLQALAASGAPSAE